RHLPAAKVAAGTRTAQRSFDTKHDAAKLLIVANLAAADEAASIIGDALASEVDVVPTDIRPRTAEMPADVEPGPANQWHRRVDAHRTRVPVGTRGKRT